MIRIREMFHTQENRGTNKLQGPVKCIRDDAWLGDAFYFWQNEEDAKMWGETSKRKTGHYDVYKCNIDCENVLDTVFNEEHYNFWIKKIELVAKIITKKTRCKPTIKELNTYFKERGDWNEVSGIMFQDLPNKEYYTIIKPIKYGEKQIYFTYRKRIQLALYNKELISNFVHYLAGECG
jgi:hypothetical protein